MKTQLFSIFHRLFRPCAGAVALALLLSGGMLTLAQSSVEKSETTQDTKKQDDELALARAAVAKPGEKPAPPETGRIIGLYSVQSTIELGYRFEDTKGSRDSFLSQINVRDGFRVLEYSLDSRSINGSGLLYDFLRADVNNAGGDAAQSFSLRMDKTRAYRFDASVRRFNYFRVPGPTFALGWKNYDQRQQVSDFNLKLFPQRAVKFNLGYGRSMATGRYTTIYSFSRDLFPVRGDSRWESNDYRAGVEASWKGWDFNLEGLYRGFKNDPQLLSNPNVEKGFNPTDPATLATFERDYPLRSHSGVFRASVKGSIAERLHLVARWLHDDERMRAPFYELSSGTSNTANVKVLSQLFSANGNVKRPSKTADLGLTLDLSRHFSISETLRYNSYKIQGDVATIQTTVNQTGTANPVTTIARTVGSDLLTDQTSWWNTLSLDMTFGRKFSANLGWRAMKRDVELALNVATPTSSPSATNPFISKDEESITTHTFVGGVRFRPVNRASFFFDVEHGQNNNAFVRINPLDFTRVRVRSQFQATSTLSFNGSFTSVDRMNPTPQVQNESDSRSYTAAVNWEPKSRFWVNGGFDHHNLFTTANLRYTLGTQVILGRLLAYGRMNSIFFNSRVGLTSRLDLLMAYYYIKDLGAPSVTLATTDTVQTLPLKRHNPELRLAYRFNNHVTGNVSYRHYSYNERDYATQDYRSNILTLSTRFTF
ncbi:MAG: hypothetical protein U0Z53_04245 [Blastocatellia bacterium]